MTEKMGGQGEYVDKYFHETSQTLMRFLKKDLGTTISKETRRKSASLWEKELNEKERSGKFESGAKFVNFLTRLATSLEIHSVLWNGLASLPNEKAVHEKRLKVSSNKIPEFDFNNYTPPVCSYFGKKESECETRFTLLHSARQVREKKAVHESIFRLIKQ